MSIYQAVADDGSDKGDSEMIIHVKCKRALVYWHRKKNRSYFSKCLQFPVQSEAVLGGHKRCQFALLWG